MIIKSLFIQQVRNIRNAALLPSPGVTVFFGDNAQGKTTVLEAAYLVTNQKNLRSSSYVDIVKDGEIFAKIVLTAENDGREYAHELRLVREGNRFKKTFFENGTQKTRAKRELKSSAVFFGPSEMRLLTGPPSRRRSFLDSILMVTEPRYGRAYNAFEKILRQRNKHLKSLALGRRDADRLLSAYDEQLSLAAAHLWKARGDLVPELLPVVHERLKLFWRGKAEARPWVSYKPALALDSSDEQQIAARYAKTLLRLRPKELVRGVTALGPQHDDLVCFQGTHEFSERASQGEMKAVVFALMSSQAAIIEKRTGTAPVFLLDDIHAEFDFNYQKDIPLLCRGFQTFITTTANPAAAWKAAVYEVVEGQFNREGGAADGRK
ncbi:hypothetical protein AUK40_03015 [Candidatus Wirthbacteria bacterium CG2_30_54_11]|uniref:DNA replication and repair protein RecF n=1 Tax=Candidatus Wirthbacteria bacterium CG2_30_54_11 TaxID=1817892 RepID=A0A1J5IKC8_9BACT|nr:MAG: hypothetical protein AUK40_03015 [Candidatus Wirthbacteria bacterium CG2_30_54_11]